MVLNTPLVVGVATLSARFWQYIACNPQRLSSQQVLDLICCFPLRQLRRLALCFCSFLCFPAPDYYDDDSSLESSSSSDYDSDDSHSD